VASGRAALAAASELKRGRIDHALRVTVRKTRRAYVAPATHCASRDDDVNLPRIGERIRLRKEFDVSGFSPEARTVLNALKKHGMFVADNGIEWAISVAPDERIPDLNRELRRVRGGLRGGYARTGGGGRAKSLKEFGSPLLPASAALIRLKNSRAVT